MPYCSNCGTQITDGSKFCSNCGAPQQQQAPPQQQYAQPPPPPTQTYNQHLNSYQPQYGEQVIGTIEGCAQGFPVTIYSLLLTNSRIVAAKVGRFNANMAVGGVAGGGLVGGLLGAGFDATVNRGRKKKTEEMAQMTPEMILAQDKKNFQIDYAGIQSVELSLPGLMQTATIKIFTPGKEHKFTIQTNKDNFSPSVALFQQVLPGRVSVK
ncbi:MAG: zinc ribbon domain-containing protein [Candidatus Bathyarchaeota archaeon]|nr:zinc ribbon domain-containing protein [Candidatus Bathyarchaeota archaeon]